MIQVELGFRLQKSLHNQNIKLGHRADGSVASVGVGALATIQDTFTSGIMGHPLTEQKRLARQVAQAVIETRPEIVHAWQAQNPSSASLAPKRRAADR